MRKASEFGLGSDDEKPDGKQMVLPCRRWRHRRLRTPPRSAVNAANILFPARHPAGPLGTDWPPSHRSVAPRLALQPQAALISGLMKINFINSSSAPFSVDGL
jgi:hypothetical protein